MTDRVPNTLLLQTYAEVVQQEYTILKNHLLCIPNAMPLVQQPE